MSVADELEAGTDEELVGLVCVEPSPGTEGTVEVAGEVGVDVVEPAGGDVAGGIGVDPEGFALEIDGTGGAVLFAVVVCGRPVIDVLLVNALLVDVLLVEEPVVMDEAALGRVLGEWSSPSVAPHAKPASPARVAEIRGVIAREQNAATRE